MTQSVNLNTSLIFRPMARRRSDEDSPNHLRYPRLVDDVEKRQSAVDWNSSPSAPLRITW